MSPVRVAFLWHMHQPSYRDPLDGSVALPWVRLHALKDYVGMVEILEETPEAHVTFNLVPSLVDQVEAYAEGRSEDALQVLGRKPPGDLGTAERVLALRALFMAHEENLIGRLPRFAELLSKRGPKSDEASLHKALERFSEADLLDLQVVSKLAWFDLGWQQRDPELRRLLAKGRGFAEEDKAALAARERALLAQVLPTYRRAAARGQVELSTSPYYHPILPLLCDTDAHHEAHPGAPVPKRYRHPEDAADQIRRALVRHEAVFGQRPAGLWPSEGSVSEQAVLEMARAGVRWTASDEGVLERSVSHALHRDSRGTAYPLELLYQPWVRKTPSGNVAMLFRDRALSDLIGFSYSRVAAPEEAARDLLDRLLRVGERWRTRALPGSPLVPIILDGENAWEHFKDGGRTFLRELYAGLQAEAGLQAQTVSEALREGTARELPRVFAGSWINADFTVWIGHADDRRAWDLLGETRQALVDHGGRLEPGERERAWEIFRGASGSDWCWWYGDDHSSENDFEFDRLFRHHLKAIYAILGLAPPDALDETLITSRKVEVRQSRPTAVVRPVLDGEITSPEEWMGAGVLRVSLGASMRRGLQMVRGIRFGVGAGYLHVLVESFGPARELLEGPEVVLSFPGPTTLRYRVGGKGQAGVRREERTNLGWVGSATEAGAAAGSVLEIAVPLSELRPGPGRTLEFRVLVVRDGIEVERHPDVGAVIINLEEVGCD